MAVEIEALDADALIEEARRATGLNDFGPDLSFMTGFRNLVEAIEAMNPPEQLRASARERILGLLAARLHFADDEKRHPEIVTQERSEEHTSELQSLMRISYAVFCLKKKKQHKNNIM